MMLALINLYLALEVKGFGQWEPKTKALFCIIVGVFTIVSTIALIRKVGVLAIALPCVIIGAMYVMNQNAGCMDAATDVKEEGSYQRSKMKQPAGAPAPAGAPKPAPAPAK